MDPEKIEGSYFAKREEREREMSRLAKNADAAAAHLDLADRYEALAVVFGAKTSLTTRTIEPEEL